MEFKIATLSLQLTYLKNNECWKPCHNEVFYYDLPPHDKGKLTHKGTCAHKHMYVGAKEKCQAETKFSLGNGVFISDARFLFANCISHTT